MKTALQWFIQQIKYINIIVPKENSDKLLSMMHQAKEMEKNNICDAWDNGYDKGTRDRIEKISNPVGNAEQYYNETFKSE
jgi:hypothetical protein